MCKKDFLLEIGVEEIPAGYIKKATEKINSFFQESLKELKLDYNKIKTFSTPRRFAIKITDLQGRQDDEIIEKIGPSIKVSYDEEGNFTRAAQGFLKNLNASKNDVFTVETPKGEKLAVKFEKKGSDTSRILADLIPELLEAIPFPKTMKWSNRNFNFARPIRWLLVLWGDKVLELEYNDLKSSNLSFGNRFLSLDKHIEIANIENYETLLESVFVIPDRENRKRMINEGLEKLLQDIEYNLVPDNLLLEIVTDLVEYPQPVMAEFNKNYLKLPEKIITNTLSQHQKYFSVTDKQNQLTNKFIFISNGDPHYSDLIRSGNEKVITARLDDAEFFFDEDVKIPLADYLPKLEEVTFQEKLGSILEKTKRVMKNTGFICETLNIGEDEKERAVRTAELCKTDLVTLMLGEKEFTKLQGYIGWKYAEISNEPEPVPLAVFEHYLPRWQNDDLPSTVEGSIVAIADKMDTVCGIIGVDMVPTGSKDPYALRRAANGVVQIIAAGNMNFNLDKLILETYNNLNEKLSKPDNNLEFVRDFMKQRINWFLQEKNINYDVIDSVMHIDHNRIPELWDRARALQKLKLSDEFIRLVTGFKRVSNIINEHREFRNFQKELLEEKTEKLLYDSYLELEAEIEQHLKKKDYSFVLQLLIKYGKIIDRFFDDVLVNVEKEDLKENRYSLLLMIRKLFMKVADLSKIVIEGN